MTSGFPGEEIRFRTHGKSGSTARTTAVGLGTHAILSEKLTALASGQRIAAGGISGVPSSVNRITRSGQLYGSPPDSQRNSGLDADDN